MSTINTSTSYSSYTSSSSTSVNSFKNEAEELLKDQVSIGKGGTYDSYATSTNSEFENPNKMDLSGIYSAAMGSTAGVTYSENGDVKSVDVKQLTYNRMSDHSNMLRLMMGEKPSSSSISEMVTSFLSSTSTASSCGVTTALTTDSGKYSVDSVAEDIISSAEKIACDDLDVLAELKDAFVEAYKSSGDSDSALSSDTYDKVLSGFAELESAITKRLEEAEAETETDVEVESDTEVEV